MQRESRRQNFAGLCRCALSSGDMKDFYDRARLALAGSGSYLRVLDENYRLLINTGVPYGEPLEPLKEPETAKAALEGGVTLTSGVFFGKLDGKWSFKVVKPYFPENGPPRLLVMTRNADSLVDVLSQQMLRGGWNASVVDKNNIVVASSLMTSDVGKPFFLDLEGTGIYHEAEPAEEREGGTYTTIVDESGVSGWKAVVWASTASIEEPMRHSLRMLLAGGLLVIAIGAFAAWLLGRQIAGPVRRLARDARRLGAGEPVHAIEYPIAEVATVSTALAEAALDREQAENEIRLLMREVAHRSKNHLRPILCSKGNDVGSQGILSGKCGRCPPPV